MVFFVEFLTCLCLSHVLEFSGVGECLVSCFCVHNCYMVSSGPNFQGDDGALFESHPPCCLTTKLRKRSSCFSECMRWNAVCWSECTESLCMWMLLAGRWIFGRIKMDPVQVNDSVDWTTALGLDWCVCVCLEVWTWFPRFAGIYSSPCIWLKICQDAQAG